MVDEKQFETMYSLFSPEIVYQRCDHLITGMEAFRDFYENGRKISGTHTIQGTVCAFKSVAVVGEFNGISRDGEVLKASFADVLTFDLRFHIRRRNTYLDDKTLRGNIPTHACDEFKVGPDTSAGTFFSERGEKTIDEITRTDGTRYVRVTIPQIGMHDKLYSAQGAQLIE